MVENMIPFLVAPDFATIRGIMIQKHIKKDSNNTNKNRSVVYMMMIYSTIS